MADLQEVKTTVSKTKRPISLLDGITNLATGLGTSKDKSSYNTWNHSGRNYDHVQLSARFREDWLSQKVVKIIPQDMTREWRELSSDEAQKADSQFEVRRLFKEAYQWARLYGTSFIIMDINDGRTEDKPLAWHRLKPGCIKSFNVVDRTRIVATGNIDQEPMSPTFAMPVTYKFVNSPVPIHKDRLIRFEGTELPIYERMRNLWYSDSILIPLMGHIDNFHTASYAAAQMVNEAAVDVVSVEGLGNILQSDEGTSAMLNRFEAWKKIKSVWGVSLLDSTESYESKRLQLSGVKDLIWEYLKIVAASVGIPATRFLSASPDGMNATGESDLINYIETLLGLHKDVFNPRLLIMDRLLSAHFGIPIEQFEFEWRCIFPESDSQKQEKLSNNVEWLARMTEAGIISRESALEAAITWGIVPKNSKIGTDPNFNQNSGVNNA